VKPPKAIAAAKATRRGAPASARARRWALLGAAFGAFAGVIAFAPATWLASALADATSGRVLLADARGTVWRGSATPVVTGGEGSRDAAVLPGRLHWQAGLDGAALRLRFEQACCLPAGAELRVGPAGGGIEWRLAGGTGAAPLAQWPAALLAGLGAPWNTLQLGGTVRVSSPGLAWRRVAGRWTVEGAAQLELDGLSSRVSPLPVLGSYRIALRGAPPGEAEDAASALRIEIATAEGPLVLTGAGQWATGTPLRFRGEARASPGSEAALNNLLNLLGRRQGAVTLLSIG
jgi:general secretion pathway protein N